MKIVLAQQNYHIGNFAFNTEKILSAIARAKVLEADLIVFSELAVCGYPPRDFVEFDDFIAQCHHAIDRIRHAADTIAVIVGSPAINPVREGKDLFNAAWLIYENEVKGMACKTCLPTYDVFDEYRYFEPAYDWKVIECKGKKIALTICEDIWNLGDNPLYRICPMDKLIGQAPDIMINISASPFDYDHDDDRKEVVRANVLKYKLPMFYCNAVGSQTEIVFDGGSLVYDAQGHLIKELNYFQEDIAVIETCDGRCVDLDPKPHIPGQQQPLDPDPIKAFDKDMRVSKLTDPAKIIDYLTSRHNIEQIHDALILGIRDYFGKMGFTQAIVGSSGGIDSAVTLALASEALGQDQVRALLMPSGFSTTHSVTDAELLSQHLQSDYTVVPINHIYESFLRALQPLFQDLPFGVAEENIQSRTRGNLLMAVANKFGYILLNTSNKSELATGYGTLYGDMAGGLSVLGDVYKMQVYALAEYINRDREIIPRNIIVKAPSAELRPGQKDIDSLPEYAVLDRVLYQYIERRRGPKEIIAMGMDPSLVNRVLKLVNSNEYKRNQFCPIIRVSCKAFGVGRRVPIVAKYLS
jgi:NAD+ synthase (glutamine-hydrolysing)